ncbi:MAG: alpha-ketoglutarate-dependent dioxygenase AlkB [Pseudomonadota bacterium]
MPQQVSATLAVATVPEPDGWLSWCEASIGWRSERITLFGQERLVPRQVAWYGEPGLCYRYSGQDHPCSGWPAALEPLRAWASEAFSTPFNFVLCNRYRDGRDSMGWHADDEPALAADVCSISFGASRRFLLEVDGERFGIDLAHGSAIRIPRTWRHAIPKTQRPVGVRVNLTFRQLFE